jgi:Mg2+-importing ATPase
VRVKIVTGDNEVVARRVCEEVGLEITGVLLGPEIDAFSDEELAAALGSVNLIAKVSPAAKARVVRALQSRGEVVGFLGDGINDAPALKQADVGISVNTAVDIARSPPISFCSKRACWCWKKACWKGGALLETS